MNNSEEQRAAWSKIVAQSWSDDEYKARLIDEPRTVLTEAGFQLPDDTDVTGAIPEWRQFQFGPHAASMSDSPGTLSLAGGAKRRDRICHARSKRPDL